MNIVEDDKAPSLLMNISFCARRYFLLLLVVFKQNW